MLAVNRIADSIGSSYSVLFTSVTSQHKQIPRYRSAFRGGLETARAYKNKLMNLQKLNLSYKKLLLIFTNLNEFLTTYFMSFVN